MFSFHYLPSIAAKENKLENATKQSTNADYLALSLSMNQLLRICRRRNAFPEKPLQDLRPLRTSWFPVGRVQRTDFENCNQLAADAVAAQNSGIVRREIDNRHLARGIALQISAFWRTMERIAARSRGGKLHLDLEDDRKQERSEDVEMVDIGDDMLALKYHTQDAATIDVIDSKSDGKVKSRADSVLISAKAHVSFIVSAGKRARSAMTPSLAESARFAA
ncbi:hypothetical protein PsorP6_001523 [Peronosclerospora sorghi]|uniref:Uncharacterized protein n=1 Tax=Peronosclerospora sorghi TaxID=230839 RepID=A0ACC0WT54_9STRA|nr:hypothetical protein PsorP6_001523 [Peronosclerospora sorghi]